MRLIRQSFIRSVVFVQWHAKSSNTHLTRHLFSSVTFSLFYRTSCHLFEALRVAIDPGSSAFVLERSTRSLSFRRFRHDHIASCIPPNM